MLLVDWEKIWEAGDDFLLSALPCAFKRHTAKPGLRRVPFHGTRQSLTPQPPRNGRHTRRKKLLFCRVPKKTHSKLLLRRVSNRKHTVKLDFAVCH